MNPLIKLSPSAMIVNFCRTPGAAVCSFYLVTVVWPDFKCVLCFNVTIFPSLDTTINLSIFTYLASTSLLIFILSINIPSEMKPILIMLVISGTIVSLLLLHNGYM